MQFATKMGVSRRRIIIPGRTWALSRRTTRRYFLFTPDRERRIEGCFWYCLAYAARKFGVQVHAAVLMSTHIHLVVTDTRGCLPWFLQSFHRLLALCIKAFRGWPEEVLNKAPTGQHELRTPEAIVEATAYLIANPVAAGAVRHARDWPGAITLPGDLGRRKLIARRPRFFFDPQNPQWPETIELAFTLPPSVTSEHGERAVRDRIRDRLHQLEHEASSEKKRRGTAFRGVRKVLRDAHVRRARNRKNYRRLNPRFAVGGDARAGVAAIAEFRAFEISYTTALARWTAGDRHALFPPGTWWMRVHHGVRCDPPS